MLKLKRLAAAFSGGLIAAAIVNVALADHHQGDENIAQLSALAEAQSSQKNTAPLKVEFSRAFGAPADGSWDGLFSGDNVIDPIKYANEKPEQTIFKSGQYALSSTTAGNEIWYGTAASVWCYWPYISMKMPLTLMNHETPNHGCQMTPPSGQRPLAQIYFHNVKTGVSTHVGPGTITNGQQFLQDSSSGLIELSTIDAMLSMPGYTYRGAGTIDKLTFFAGSNQYAVAKIKSEWLDKLTPEQRAIELKKFPKDLDFNQEGLLGYNRIFVFDNIKKKYLGYAEFFGSTGNPVGRG